MQAVISIWRLNPSVHRAKGDRFVRDNELPVCDNGKVAVYRYTISAFWGKFRRPLAALDRCTLNRGAFAFKIVRGDPDVAV